MIVGFQQKVALNPAILLPVNGFSHSLRIDDSTAGEQTLLFRKIDGGVDKPKWYTLNLWFSQS